MKFLFVTLLLLMLNVHSAQVLHGDKTLTIFTDGDTIGSKDGWNFEISDAGGTKRFWQKEDEFGNSKDLWIEMTKDKKVRSFTGIYEWAGKDTSKYVEFSEDGQPKSYTGCRESNCVTVTKKLCEDLSGFLGSKLDNDFDGLELASKKIEECRALSSDLLKKIYHPHKDDIKESYGNAITKLAAVSLSKEFFSSNPWGFLGKLVWGSPNKDKVKEYVKSSLDAENTLTDYLTELHTNCVRLEDLTTPEKVKLSSLRPSSGSTSSNAK